MNKTAHLRRHKMLHHMLDELIADWISETETRPLQRTVGELLAWSHSQTEDPSDREGRYSDEDWLAVRCYDIKWDTDGADVELPEELTLSLYSDLDVVLGGLTLDEFLDEHLADALSDKHGFCVSSVSYEKLTELPSLKLTEAQVTDALSNWIESADADELARVTGELFGGNCYADYDDARGNVYSFTPNKEYCGAFD